MDKHTFTVLEFETIRDIIARKTTNIYGREHIEQRYPMKEYEDIIILQKETAEALTIFSSTEPFTVGQLDDVRSTLTLTEKEVPLRPEEILKIYEVTNRSRLLKKYLSAREAMVPQLSQESEMLSIFPELENEIKRAISSEGLILDSASKKLEAIREQLDILSGRIQKQLENFLRNPDFLKMLQEPIITRREYRYVLPVKQEFRSQFPGLVLDSSASGATLFMEPTVVLHLTNELKFQKSEEQREEEQIRLKLSKKIGAVAADIFQNIEFLGHFDALQASARYMLDNKAFLPHIKQDPMLQIREARHPLLGDRAVPIDIHIGTDFKGLIITGPNTGGKTVTLKTAGILALMALAGFPIPAREDSQVGMFTGVYADIGDEQSISQNLSTFSSPIANITKILPRAGRRTLVLLDELGAGTDPSEGVALASSILMYLIRRKTCVVATTHYNELKVFAANNEDLANAAVEFNEETLAPTYRIQIGIPGRSCALKIAERLGVPSDVLAEAQELLGPSYFTLETLLTELDNEKTQVVREKESVQENREALEKLKNEYSEKIADLEQEKDQIIDEARQEAENLVTEITAELQEARKEWRKSLKEYRQGKKTREELRTEEKAFRSKMDHTIERLTGMQKHDIDEELEETSEYVEGTAVEVVSLARRGKILRIQDSRQALVEIGNIKIEVPFKDLKAVDLDFKSELEPIREMRVSKALTITDQLDLRGFRAEDALESLSKYLDDAMLANLHSVRILHGKGTGALREAIREYLRKFPYIKSFKDGDLHEGGWGVTVVKLQDYE